MNGIIVSPILVLLAIFAFGIIREILRAHPLTEEEAAEDARNSRLDSWDGVGQKSVHSR